MADTNPNPNEPQPSSSQGMVSRPENSLSRSSHSRTNVQDYYSSNTSQGPIKKRPQRSKQEFRSSNPKFAKSSNLKATAPEFYPSNFNETAKKETKPVWKDRYPRNSWRSSGLEHETGQERNNTERPSNSRYSESSRGYNNRRFYNNSAGRYEPRYERNYDGNSKFMNGMPSQVDNERFSNVNAYEQNHTFHPGQRDGFANKSNIKQKRSDRNYSNPSENRYTNKFKDKRNKHTDTYYGKDKKVDSNRWLDSNVNRNFSAAGQRERLIEMIDGRVLECMVCCEKIKTSDKIWSCTQCYHIIHIDCVVAWAESSKIEGNWRCPACQNVCTNIPTEYTCYCGKTKNPKINPNLIAHGCDNMCLKPGKNCDHKCSILCHPGPCPECNIMVSKPCGCGATHQVVKCSSDIKIICTSECNKTLNCGIHQCLQKCHVGPCDPCSDTIIQECFCGQTGRKVPCNAETSGKYTFICDNICNKLLPCGNHKCEKQCHAGACGLCETDINTIKFCFCGKTPLLTERTSCLDIIPSCNNICGKSLICGPPSMPHTCKEKCHSGKCPPCLLTTVIRCRCGHMDKEMACQKLTTKADDARCEKKCTKKRLCGKHTCKQKCCIEIEHVCPLPCNHLLSCGLHKCELTCHSGRCPPCMETSFEELYCECGASVIYPPVPCGTKPPGCSKPCSKSRVCGHSPNHECHPGPCPPCFVLTKQWCYGQHEERSAIPCNQRSFSCGLPCGKPMPCGRHTCIKPCHENRCPVPCIQPCSIARALCGHPCNKPCHNSPCPESTCKQMVPVTCPCGLQKSSKICMDLTEEYRNIEMAQIKDKIGNLSFNNAVDISDIMVKKPSVLKILECTDECRILERNRRLAIGLQIQNPDLSQKLTPRYSDFLKQWGKRDPKFCQRIHDKLSELVQLAKQSKQKSRSYSFESMNRDKRAFIHEYCEYFGIESAAYDAEPNRNVVATAIRDKSWLPSMSLIEVLQRENGQRKVPGPVLGCSATGVSESVSLKVPKTMNSFKTERQ